MDKAPKVLTRMRLSCCWGDNLNEKELNEVVDYIEDLEHQVKKQKEVIDKAIEYNKELSEMYDIGSMERSNADTNLLILGDIKTIDILKEVSE